MLYHAHLKKAAELAAGSGTTIRMDGDPYWFNNPQFRVSVGAGEPADLYVSLMQQDRRTAKRLRDNFPVAFEVVRMRKTPDHHPRCWELDPSELVADSASATFSSRFPQREVSKGSIRLDPGHSYNIVPHASLRGREGKFFVRVFSPKSADVKIAAVPEAKSVYLPGVWERQPERETAGGPLRLMGKGAGLRDNPKWCQNPQFHLSLPEELGSTSVDVKLVLRRTDNADDARRQARASRAARLGAGADEPANVFVGLTVVKAAAPEPTARRRAGATATPCTNALGEPMPTKASSLSGRPRARRRRGGAIQPEDGGGGGTQVDRKMVVASTEWCELSTTRPRRSRRRCSRASRATARRTGCSSCRRSRAGREGHVRARGAHGRGRQGRGAARVDVEDVRGRVDREGGGRLAPQHDLLQEPALPPAHRVAAPRQGEDRALAARGRVEGQVREGHGRLHDGLLHLPRAAPRPAPRDGLLHARRQAVGRVGVRAHVDSLDADQLLYRAARERRGVHHYARDV